ncbi:membrane protein insertase YidC, partial [candidate division KSB1 bacterium]|nr:membrane protein insertase YidC [candidate division KSB1 bacterium]
ESTNEIEGKIDWVAIRTKYFASIIFPDTEDDISARLSGATESFGDEKVDKTFKAFLEMRMPYSSRDSEIRNFQVYLGPLDYYLVKQYDDGFDEIMGYGPAIIRPFAKLTIRVFRFLHGFIPNYGVVLIVFSILVKIVVYPLTRKSYVAMREMQKLQPLMTEMREKYKNDPQRLNKEMMALYKEHGVNPLSGCLPTLLQMPLLWAIFLVFRNTIQLRQAEFIWWINDLSSPDTILLPFSMPLIGNELHIIPLLMGATMFIQQRMTMKDPKQKAMVYFMPIFLTFIFYNFPSGLNLYYTLFNLFSMLQQKLTSDKHDIPESEMSQNNKKSKK